MDSSSSSLPTEIWHHILRDHLPHEWKGIAACTCTTFWSLLLESVDTAATTAATRRGVKCKRGSEPAPAPATVLVLLLPPTPPLLYMSACASSVPLIQWACHNHCPWNE